MLARYYKSSRTFTHFKEGPAGPFLDDFVKGLQQRGYSARTIRYHVGAVHHLCCWAAEKGLAPSTLDDPECHSFLRHLSSCRCSLTAPGRFIHHARFSVPLFMAHLRQTGVLPAPERKEAAREPLLVGFRHWMLQHRGVRESTLKLYDRVLSSLLSTVKGDPGCLDAQRLRAFLLQRSKEVAAGTAKNEANAIRMFIRYLIGQEKAPAGLDAALPTVANWRLAALPRYLSSAEIDRLIAD